jgi:hypothetical protein
MSQRCVVGRFTTHGATPPHGDDDGRMQRSLLGVVMRVGLAVAALAACGDDDAAAPTTAPATRATAAASTGDSTATSSAGRGAPSTTLSAADATEDDYLAAIERSLSTGDGLRTTAEQAECMAPKWLDTIGLDRLREHDLAPSEIGDDVDDDGSALSDLGLSQEEGTALYDAFGDCDVDIGQQFVEFATEGQSPAVVSCVGDALTPDLLRRLMVSSIVEGQPDDQLQADFEAAIGPCDALREGATATTSG